MKIKLCQMSFLVGDVQGNTTKIIDTAINNTNDDCADILLFPELALTGYPPEDLLFKHDLYQKVQNGLKAIIELSLTINQALVIGHPVRENDKSYNALSVIYQGEILHQYRKQKLPNFSVFDEARYFHAGDRTGIFEFKGVRIGLLICEDVWNQEPVDALSKENSQLVLISNASPFHSGKIEKRQRLLQRQQSVLNCPLLYLNLVGAQDELVFDGGSMVLDENGKIVTQLPQFKSYFSTIDINKGVLANWTQSDTQPLSRIAELYQALVSGVRDYVHNNGFKGAVIGLSGGIDSALTLKIAVDALGAENVTAIMMPFSYTSEMSLEDAKKQTELLQVKYEVISIEPIYKSFESALEPYFKNYQRDKTEENLQSRCRGVLLMAMSNKTGSIVLTTGNKSEMAVGYATLYGDMAGGFGVLKDVFKTDVFALARYCNQEQESIPERVIQRPPSAELSPDQKDEDSLPPYEILDPILEAYIERECSFQDIVELGFDPVVVAKTINLVDLNEHKRRQSPPGVRVTSRAFGKDHRYPITSAYRRQTNDV